MNLISRNRKKAFTLIELVVVIVILGILAAIIVPIINRILETANRTTDNANARLIYNAAAMWYSENNQADDDLLASEVIKYLGLSTYPNANSLAFGGSFSVTVTLNGVITVKTSKPATYDPYIGKLKP
jgi:prepilin-type N-terminal cleavage/methylation domain-containing protein